MARTPPYPPLTPLAKFPLHSRDPRGHGIPYACERVESPWEAYDWRCPDCVALAEARIAERGDVATVYRDNDEAEEQVVMLSWLVARSRYWLPRITNLYDGD